METVGFSGMPSNLRRPLIVFMVITMSVVGGTHLGIVSGLTMWLGGWWVTRVYNARAERLASERGIRQ